MENIHLYASCMQPHPELQYYDLQKILFIDYSSMKIDPLHLGKNENC